jgi:hypothetical protein
MVTGGLDFLVELLDLDVVRQHKIQNVLIGFLPRFGIVFGRHLGLFRMAKGASKTRNC